MTSTSTYTNDTINRESIRTLRISMDGTGYTAIQIKEIPELRGGSPALLGITTISRLYIITIKNSMSSLPQKQRIQKQRQRSPLQTTNTVGYAPQTSAFA